MFINSIMSTILKDLVVYAAKFFYAKIKNFSVLD